MINHIKNIPIAAEQFINRRSTKIIIFISASIAAVATWHYYESGDILAYGDAESHINISKRMVDGVTPGFGQLGGVWLPMQHVLMAPFVMADSMWRSGLGGAVVSGLCYVWSSVYIYRLALLLSRRVSAAWAAAAIYMLNPNVIYLATTPMSELPLLAFSIASMYYFARWVKDRELWCLVYAGGLSLGTVLTRYDGWFLVFAQAGGMALVALSERWQWRKFEAMLMVLVSPAMLGVFIWVIWCWTIFDNPLYFLNGPYSARSQQDVWRADGELLTDHNLPLSIIYYAKAVIDNIGLPVVILSTLGSAALIVRKTWRGLGGSLAILGALTSPIIFNIISLFLGISILLVPGLTPDAFDWNLFNIRYGLMALPAAAVLPAVLIARINSQRAAIVISSIVVVAVSVWTLGGLRPITLQDGQIGLSQRVTSEGSRQMNTYIANHYDDGYIAFDSFAKSVNATDLNIPMNKMLDVGSHPYWDQMLKNPNQYARYIVIKDGDILWQNFNNDPNLEQKYQLVTKFDQVRLYECVVDCRTEFKD